MPFKPDFAGLLDCWRCFCISLGGCFRRFSIGFSIRLGIRFYFSFGVGFSF